MEAGSLFGMDTKSNEDVTHITQQPKTGKNTPIHLSHCKME